VALVFALYRELTASFLMALLAFQACYMGGHTLKIEKKDWLRFLIMVRRYGEVRKGIAQAL